MARPKQNNNNREKMLVAGIRLLKEYGYHGMSIKQLVDDISIPKGSFYNYFSSKEAFVVEVIEQYGQESSKTILNALSTQGSAKEQIKNFFIALELTLDTNGAPSPCLVSALTNEVAQSSLTCREKLLEVVTLAKQHLTRLIITGQQQGCINSSLSPESTASLLYNCWHGQLLQYQLTGSKRELRKQITDLLDLIQ